MSKSDDKVFTYEELKEHKTAKSLWLAISDEVFDITKFLEEHPGGVEVLLDQAGSYATDAFEDVGHSQDARDLMVNYKIGVMAEKDHEAKSSRPKASPESPDGGQTSSLTGWLIPLGIAVAAALVYRFVLSPSGN